MIYRTSDIIQKWDLAIEMLGDIFDTRPLVLADIEKIQQLSSMQPEDQFAFVRSLFKGDKQPPIDGDHPELATVAITIIGQYAKARAEKNARAIAEGIGAAMANPSTSGR